MPIAQEAAIGFARQLHKEDQAEIIDFDSQVRILAPFTNDGPALEKAIRADDRQRIDIALQRDLHLAEGAAEDQSASESDIRRQAIVLLSDGDDTSSLMPVRRGAGSRQTIRDVDLRDRAPPAGDRAPGVQGSGIRAASTPQETGGRAFFPTDAGAAEDLRADLGRAREPVPVGYTSQQPEARRRWRRILVRIQRPGLTARTKQGYYGPTGS